MYNKTYLITPALTSQFCPCRYFNSYNYSTMYFNSLLSEELTIYKVYKNYLINKYEK